MRHDKAISGRVPGTRRLQGGTREFDSFIYPFLMFSPSFCPCILFVFPFFPFFAFSVFAFFVFSCYWLVMKEVKRLIIHYRR